MAIKSFGFWSGLSQVGPGATPRARANRQAVWKLLGLLLVEYKATDNAMWPELRRLLSHVGDRDSSSQMTDFIAEHLKDRVSF